MDLPVNFDLRNIQVFIAVAEAGGVTAAARRLGITQSSVSQHVANLEKSLGLELFDRSVRPIALTAAGTVLFDRGRPLLASAGDVLGKVRETSSKSRFSSLTLGMPESFANTVGPPLATELKGFADHWRLWAGISPQNETQLMNHSVDLIVTTSDDLKKIDGLEHHLIMTEPFVIVTGRDAPDRADLEDLASMPFIRYSLRSAIGRQIERQVDRLKLEMPVELEFDTATGQLAAVADGMGWSITTPLCLLQEMARLPALRVHPIRRGRFSREISLVARKGELGDLPATIAGKSRVILKDRKLPDLFRELNWIEPLIRWPEATDAEAEA